MCRCTTSINVARRCFPGRTHVRLYEAPICLLRREIDATAAGGAVNPCPLPPRLADDSEHSPYGDEFFIRKAIGWALRDHARRDPEWVRDFVRDHELAPLSQREALKHLS
ncbi:hypothetical protein FNY88_04750 [Corynebacterium guaraldiae]|uniref:DNA alkylation repair enzyme n=1 Tax=Corynebacterium guaraldiae TaxID=3051103 RepID=A0ABY3CUU2_9CORY|nr:hypothetical protein FNY88_04750 [Corynebacterium guaraldiae]TRX52578.1 hypothetical protein FNY91_06570 [Corynebacterium guaraldiae]